MKIKQGILQPSFLKQQQQQQLQQEAKQQTSHPIIQRIPMPRNTAIGNIRSTYIFIFSFPSSSNDNNLSLSLSSGFPSSFPPLSSFPLLLSLLFGIVFGFSELSSSLINPSKTPIKALTYLLSLSLHSINPGSKSILFKSPD